LIHLVNHCVDDRLHITCLQVDLTKYQEKHQFNFDEALDENVTQEQVSELLENISAGH
jgi:hypothetical protein